MPSYNTGKYISESINSVINQTYTDWELIIVDDASNDETDSIVSNYLKDKRIRYIKKNRNCGAALCRNAAISEAKGRWVAFLDSDDVWKSDKLEKQIKFMEEKEEPFKVELINDLPEGEAISFYKQGEFTDLCAGPHLDFTGRIKGNALKLLTCKKE